MSWRDIAANGLWHNNAGLVQLLGLCPLLAVTNTATNGLGLGLATILTLLITNISVSLIRHQLRPEIRIPVFVMIIAAAVTAIELLVNAYAHELYRSLGIFLPLIVTNCAIIGRAEAYASRNSLGPAALDGLAVGIGFAAVLIALGMFRELLGQGTLFADLPLMLGWSDAAPPSHDGLLLALLPPGGFFGLALLIALRQALIQRRSGNQETPQLES